MAIRKIKATELKPGMFLADDEDYPTSRENREVISVKRGNGIVRFVSENGSGYFDETSTVEIER